MGHLLERLFRRVSLQYFADLGAVLQDGKPHPYPALDSLAQEIWLVVLLPAVSDSADIHASFVRVSIHDDVEYEALSYV